MGIRDVRKQLDGEGDDTVLDRSDSAEALSTRDQGGQEASMQDGSDAFESNRATLNMITQA
ncbi:hypothetical protein MARA_00650 (plasmid) [Mycolicibacterium arabiense]|uniref:Uncharacterized protein n=1 Tax=Mycolicibacterium arabiense TaxID=1286181 RepID=A0A7I7RS18_9MYCO|nr:hypothetical protein [Mycolicibacterium arabiense]MCV7372035.1 hypothetical protein [Mycolicibacterium arabiense]BBY46635.1 hypothetical protein MARA_00650 [Mycolicibacterium arabiense]